MTDRERIEALEAEVARLRELVMQMSEPQIVWRPRIDLPENDELPRHWMSIENCTVNGEPSGRQTV